MALLLSDTGALTGIGRATALPLPKKANGRRVGRRRAKARHSKPTS